MASIDGTFFEMAYCEMEANNCPCPDEGPILLADVTGPGIIQGAADDELGVDLDVITDLRPSFILCGGFRNLGNAIARRLSTPPGSLAAIGDDPDYGYDLRGLLNSEMSEEEIGRIGSDVEAEIMKEDRVQSAKVVSTYTWASYDLAVEIEILTKSGPFRLILGVSELTVDVLNEGIVRGETV
jgi:hypothetical protein